MSYLVAMSGYGSEGKQQCYISKCVETQTKEWTLFHPPPIDILISMLLESWIWSVIGALTICVIQQPLTGIQATRAL